MIDTTPVRRLEIGSMAHLPSQQTMHPGTHIHAMCSRKKDAARPDETSRVLGTDQPLTAIFFHFDCSVLGRVSSSTPLRYLAATLSASTAAGRVTYRSNRRS